jgi:hypothetical protein
MLHQPWYSIYGLKYSLNLKQLLKHLLPTLVFNASRNRGQAIHLLSEEAKQLLHPVTGLREAVRSMQTDGQPGWGKQLSAMS